MENPGTTGRHDLHLASRKAEEAASRRFEAAGWLESFVGPLGISSQPPEREFISCLRNGLILCRAINKIKPGAVPKVVDSHIPLQSLTWDFQSLPAYQYFENVRNFLDAVEGLNLPVFEASDLGRDNLEAGSVAKVVDCILALKSYHEWKQMSTGGGLGKHSKSPLATNSANRGHPHVPGLFNSDSCRKLDMFASCEGQQLGGSEIQNLEDLLVKALTEHMICAKENIDDNLLGSYHRGNQDVVKHFVRVLSSCLGEQLLAKFPAVKAIFNDLLIERCNTVSQSRSAPLQDILPVRHSKMEGMFEHERLFQVQEKDLSDLKTLLSKTKGEYEDLRLELQRDMKLLGSHLKGLSTAALGYQKVAKENKNLHNMVMDLKGNIRVHCRIRPAFTAEAKSVIDFVGDDGHLLILDPSKPQKDARKDFQFNHLFGPSASQDEVFKETKPLIRSVMDGYNVCIFAYGQTGSGKTHTMSGPSGGFAKDMGITYLALSDLFELSNKRKNAITYEIHVQMVEIYNERVRDLLSENSVATKLEIRSCTAKNGMNLPDATMHSVRSTVDVLTLMKLGEMNRVVGSTAVNNRSSRSHSVLTVHVHGKDSSGNMTSSCLHLVDLAGSERVNKSEVTGDRLKEAQCINKSLSCLGDVITALAQKSSHIPYRNSKLTLLLQDSLGGHAKTLMLAHVSPEEESYGETMSTLKFAQRVSSVELGAARLNKETSEVLDLKEEVESLKKALASKEAQSAHAQRNPLNNVGRMNSESYGMESSGEKKATKTSPAPVRLRRLSLDPKYGKKDHGHDVKKQPLAFKQLEDVEVEAAACRPLGLGHGYPAAQTSRYRTPPPGSRTTSAAEKPVPAGRDDVRGLVQGAIWYSAAAEPSGSNGGKRSQVKKSLRTIGKMMSGVSDKRNLQQAEVSSNGNDSVWQPAAKARPHRRQSLGGIQMSRRSSLGGKSADSCKPRNARTPPPEHESPMTAKRWL